MKKRILLLFALFFLIILIFLIFKTIKYKNIFWAESNAVWPYNAINYTSSLTIPERSKVKIAIIDTGISAESPCLKTWNIKKLYVGNAADNDNKHGTLVSSALCSNKMMHQKTSKGNTILENTILYSIDIGTDANITVESLIKGINLAIKQEVDIINLSLGTYKNDSKLERAIKLANENHIIVIVAAGNDMTRQDLYPASYNNVISVSAYDEEEKYLYTNNINNSTVISAPGINISTGITGVKDMPEKMGGTSVSSSIVTALATIIRTINPEVDSADFIKMLEYTSRDLGKSGRDEYYGFGSIDYKKMVSYTSNPFFYKLADVFY